MGSYLDLNSIIIYALLNIVSDEADDGLTAR